MHPGDEKPAAAVAAAQERQQSRTSLLRELDRLAERVERAAGLVAELRADAAALRAELGRLKRDHARLLQAAGVSSPDELLPKMARLAELEKSQRAMEKERIEAARRLAELVEKVDLLREES